MGKSFNTAGPMIPEDHYYISFRERIDWEEIQHLIAQKRYFLVHAPRRTDLIIEWPLDEERGFFGPVQKVVLELKILCGDRDSLIADGLKQTAAYADGCGAEEAHLIVFNRDPKVFWEDKISFAWDEYDGRRIGVWEI